MHQVNLNHMLGFVIFVVGDPVAASAFASTAAERAALRPSRLARATRRLRSPQWRLSTFFQRQEGFPADAGRDSDR